MGGVLLLNATYEPMRVLPLSRAVVLLIQNKAEVVERCDDQMIRSENLAIEKPKVIRLLYFVKIPYKTNAPISNRAVLVRDRFKCAYCRNKANTIDHVHPKSKGGTHDWKNVVAACRPCNQTKGNRTLEQLSWGLSFKPDRPTHHRWVVVGKIDESWEPYLTGTASA